MHTFILFDYFLCWCYTVNVYIHNEGEMIITFCGHSNYIGNSRDEECLLNYFEKVIKENEVDFYFGGYGGFDRFALSCAKKYKKTHKNANLIFIAPYLGNWLNSRKEFLESSYDMIIYPDIENVPKKFAIIKRNQWMVNHADYLFAYVRTHYGGAYKTLLYAHKHKKRYTNLYIGDYQLE